MPVFFGYAADSTRKPSDSLRARNINLLRVAPSRFNIQIVPDALVAGYQFFITYLYVFILSIAHRQAWGAHRTGIIPKLPDYLSLPLTLPPLAIQVKDNNIRVIDTLIQSGFYQQAVQRRTLLLKDQPTVSDVESCMKNPSIIRDNYVPWKYVNLNAMLAYFIIAKFASLLSTFNLPSAFKTMDDVKNFANGSFETTTSSSSGKPESSTATASSKFVTSYSYAAKFAKTVTGWNVSPTPLDVQWDQLASRVPVTHTFSTIRTAITMSGVFLPFVPDLARRDDDGPLPFITKYLFRCLGTSLDSCQKNLEFVRSGWGVLSKTEAGDVFSHMFKCFELALEGQSQTALIFTNNVYEGMVLQGDGYTILVPGNSARPRSKDELIADIAAHKGHDASITEITDILSTYRAGKMSDVEASDISSMSILRRLVLETPIPQNRIDEVRAAAYRLRFEDSWAVNPTTLNKFLNIVSSGDMPDDTPISPLGIDELDVGAAALTAFGMQCPSFLIPNGRALDLRGAIPQPKMESTIAKGKKRLIETPVDEFEQTVQVRICSYRAARNDLVEMRRDGIIRVVPGQNRKAGSIRVFRGQTRADLWVALSATVHKSSESKDVGHPTQDIGGSALGGAGTVREEDLGMDDMFAF